VPKSKGSVVSLAADAANGRLIAGPQYGNLFAIRPGADADATAIEAVEPAIGRAHGLLVVENDLFAVVNEGGGDARGVWRLRDTDGDGRYDEKKQLAAVARDGGEHGPHQVAQNSTTWTWPFSIASSLSPLIHSSYWRAGAASPGAMRFTSEAFGAVCAGAFAASIGVAGTMRPALPAGAESCGSARARRSATSAPATSAPRQPRLHRRRRRRRQLSVRGRRGRVMRLNQ